jgi:hypothetical protein
VRLTNPSDGVLSVCDELLPSESSALSFSVGSLDLSDIIPMSVISGPFNLQLNAIELGVPDRVRFARNRFEKRGGKNDEI